MSMCIKCANSYTQKESKHQFCKLYGEKTNITLMCTGFEIAKEEKKDG